MGLQEMQHFIQAMGGTNKYQICLSQIKTLDVVI